MLGAIVGDIIGSSYEFEDMRDYNFELIPEGSRFTDDSVMTLAVAKWLTDSQKNGLTKESLIQQMQDLGRKYPDAGYGSSFNSWLWSENPQPYNSWGNGSAMRVSPVGLFAKNIEDALRLAKITAEVSHNHPEGIKGAQAVAAAVWLAYNGYTKDDIRYYITKQFGYNLERKIDDIRQTYQWTSSCQGSVAEAIIAFLEGDDFEDVVRRAVSLGGDSDTQAAIAGSIAACMYSIPKWIETRCEELLSQELYWMMMEFIICVVARTLLFR